MPNTIGSKFGDVVLVPFPFTDQTASKKRPAVVVSSDAYHRDRPDVIVVAITSRVAQAAASVGDVLLEDWRGAGLLRGIVGARSGCVSAPTRVNMKNVRGLPIRPWMLSPNARLKPTTIHRMLMTPIVTKRIVDTDHDRSRLADPKDKIELYNLVLATARERDPTTTRTPEGSGLKALREVVSRDPRVIRRLADDQGNEILTPPRVHRALECFQKALTLKTGPRPGRLQHGQRLPDARPGR